MESHNSNESSTEDKCNNGCKNGVTCKNGCFEQEIGHIEEYAIKTEKLSNKTFRLTKTVLKKDNFTNDEIEKINRAVAEYKPEEVKKTKRGKKISGGPPSQYVNKAPVSKILFWVNDDPTIRAQMFQEKMQIWRGYKKSQEELKSQQQNTIKKKSAVEKCSENLNIPCTVSSDQDVRNEYDRLDQEGNKEEISTQVPSNEEDSDILMDIITSSNDDLYNSRSDTNVDSSCDVPISPSDEFIVSNSELSAKQQLESSEQIQTVSSSTNNEEDSQSYYLEMMNCTELQQESVKCLKRRKTKNPLNYEEWEREHSPDRSPTSSSNTYDHTPLSTKRMKITGSPSSSFPSHECYSSPRQECSDHEHNDVEFEGHSYSPLHDNHIIEDDINDAALTEQTCQTSQAPFQIFTTTASVILPNSHVNHLQDAQTKIVESECQDEPHDSGPISQDDDNTRRLAINKLDDSSDAATVESLLFQEAKVSENENSAPVNETDNLINKLRIITKTPESQETPRSSFKSPMKAYGVADVFIFPSLALQDSNLDSDPDNNEGKQDKVDENEESLENSPPVFPKYPELNNSDSENSEVIATYSIEAEPPPESTSTVIEPKLNVTTQVPSTAIEYPVNAQEEEQQEALSPSVPSTFQFLTNVQEDEQMEASAPSPTTGTDLPSTATEPEPPSFNNQEDAPQEDAPRPIDLVDDSKDEEITICEDDLNTPFPLQNIQDDQTLPSSNTIEESERDNSSPLFPAYSSNCSSNNRSRRVSSSSNETIHATNKKMRMMTSPYSSQEIETEPADTDLSKSNESSENSRTRNSISKPASPISELSNAKLFIGEDKAEIRVFVGLSKSECQDEPHDSGSISHKEDDVNTRVAINKLDDSSDAATVESLLFQEAKVSESKNAAFPPSLDDTDDAVMQIDHSLHEYDNTTEDVNGNEGKQDKVDKNEENTQNSPPVLPKYPEVNHADSENSEVIATCCIDAEPPPEYPANAQEEEQQGTLSASVPSTYAQEDEQMEASASAPTTGTDLTSPATEPEPEPPSFNNQEAKEDTLSHPTLSTFSDTVTDKMSDFQSHMDQPPPISLPFDELKSPSYNNNKDAPYSIELQDAQPDQTIPSSNTIEESERDNSSPPFPAHSSNCSSNNRSRRVSSSSNETIHATNKKMRMMTSPYSSQEIETEPADTDLSSVSPIPIETRNRKNTKFFSKPKADAPLARSLQKVKIFPKTYKFFPIQKDYEETDFKMFQRKDLNRTFFKRGELIVKYSDVHSILESLTLNVYEMFIEHIVNEDARFHFIKWKLLKMMLEDSVDPKLNNYDKNELIKLERSKILQDPPAQFIILSYFDEIIFSPIIWIIDKKNRTFEIFDSRQWDGTLADIINDNSCKVLQELYKRMTDHLKRFQEIAGNLTENDKILPEINDWPGAMELIKNPEVRLPDNSIQEGHITIGFIMDLLNSRHKDEYFKHLRDFSPDLRAGKCYLLKLLKEIKDSSDGDSLFDDLPYQNTKRIQTSQDNSDKAVVMSSQEKKSNSTTTATVKKFPSLAKPKKKFNSTTTATVTKIPSLAKPKKKSNSTTTATVTKFPSLAKPKKTSNSTTTATEQEIIVLSSDEEEDLTTTTTKSSRPLEITEKEICNSEEEDADDDESVTSDGSDDDDDDDEDYNPDDDDDDVEYSVDDEEAQLYKSMRGEQVPQETKKSKHIKKKHGPQDRKLSKPTTVDTTALVVDESTQDIIQSVTDLFNKKFPRTGELKTRQKKSNPPASNSENLSPSDLNQQQKLVFNPLSNVAPKPQNPCLKQKQSSESPLKILSKPIYFAVINEARIDGTKDERLLVYPKNKKHLQSNEKTNQSESQDISALYYQSDRDREQIRIGYNHQTNKKNEFIILDIRFGITFQKHLQKYPVFVDLLNLALHTLPSEPKRITLNLGIVYKLLQVLTDAGHPIFLIAKESYFGNWKGDWRSLEEAMQYHWSEKNVHIEKLSDRNDGVKDVDDLSIIVNAIATFGFIISFDKFRDFAVESSACVSTFLKKSVFTFNECYETFSDYDDTKNRYSWPYDEKKFSRTPRDRANFVKLYDKQKEMKKIPCAVKK